MLSMDPQCTHILLLYSVKNGYIWDLLIMFFCSSLSRTDVKNTMVRHNLQTPDDKSHVTDTNLLVVPEQVFVAC